MGLEQHYDWHYIKNIHGNQAVCGAIWERYYPSIGRKLLNKYCTTNTSHVTCKTCVAIVKGIIPEPYHNYKFDIKELYP